ncbi:MAG: stage III sporulation protein SpoIIIAB [Thermaerobacterales bacterium]
MVETRLIGSLLVVAGSGALGYSLADAWRRRPEELARLQSCLQVLMTEMDYGLTPLAEAWERAAGAADGVVSLLFLRAADHLRAASGITPRDAWRRSVLETYGDMAIEKSEMEMMSALGASLGASDRHDQRRHIELCLKRLEAAERSARNDAARNFRLYQYLGLISGGLVVALLV